MNTATQLIGSAQAVLAESGAPRLLRDLAARPLAKFQAEATGQANYPVVQFPLQVHAAHGRPFDEVVPVIRACVLLHAAADLLDDAQDGDLGPAWEGLGWEQASTAAQLLLGLAVRQAASWPGGDRAALVERFGRAVTQMAMGQHLDLLNVQDRPLTFETYLEAARWKTGGSCRLFCEAGALAAAAGTAHVEAFGRFGEAVGTAMQLVTDTKDHVLGRGSDARNGKRTLPTLVGVVPAPGTPPAGSAWIPEACRPAIEGLLAEARAALGTLRLANRHSDYLLRWTDLEVVTA